MMTAKEYDAARLTLTAAALQGLAVNGSLLDAVTYAHLADKAVTLANATLRRFLNGATPPTPGRDGT